MDIERLETLRKMLKHNIELEDEEIENLCELIDEAIARKSVTSDGYWKGLREEFMDNLRGCDTVTISLSGLGSTDYSTQEIYNMMMAFGY